MSEHFKPGDVAVVTRLGKPEIAIRTHNSPEHFDWFTAYGSGIYDDAHRVAVIDFENREEVERFAAAAYPWYASNPRALNIRADQMQAAFREFANPTPPKPDEPLGLGAVVEDAEGEQYLRAYEKGSMPWVRLRKSSANGRHLDRANLGNHRWSSIAAVRVLSEGIS